MTSTVNLSFAFRTQPWDAKVEEVCESWKGTPYKLNGCSREGIDCLHFVATVLDQLYGVRHSKNLKSLPPDACVHNKQGVMKAGRALFSAYPEHRRVLDGSLEAGDLVLTGPISDTPTTSHLMIAGKRGKLWQCNSFGVGFTGYGIPSSEMLVAVYRSFEKVRWL